MAAERTPGIDFSGLEETVDWIKARKNLFVGLVLVIALGWAASVFFVNQHEESLRDPWRAVLAAGGGPWEAQEDALAQAASDPRVKGTPAEPYVLYWQALQKLRSGDSAAALAQLDDFKRKFPNHLLLQTKLPGNHLELQNAVERIEAQVRELDAWKAQHPLPNANPPPTGATAVTLVTERGNVVIALYPDLAPKSCEVFLKVASELKDRFVAKTNPDKWLELGQNEAGVAVETKAVGDAFPPFEENALHHLPGAVAFRRAPFGKAPFEADVRVTLAPDFDEDGRSTIFGQVIQGFDLLVAIAKEARKSGDPQLLEKPVKITDVQLGPPPAPAPPSEPAPK